MSWESYSTRPILLITGSNAKINNKQNKQVLAKWFLTDIVLKIIVLRDIYSTWIVPLSCWREKGTKRELDSISPLFLAKQDNRI